MSNSFNSPFIFPFNCSICYILCEEFFEFQDDFLEHTLRTIKKCNQFQFHELMTYRQAEICELSNKCTTISIFIAPPLRKRIFSVLKLKINWNSLWATTLLKSMFSINHKPFVSTWINRINVKWNEIFLFESRLKMHHIPLATWIQMTDRCWAAVNFSRKSNGPFDVYLHFTWMRYNAFGCNVSGRFRSTTMQCFLIGLNYLEWYGNKKDAHNIKTLVLRTIAKKKRKWIFFHEMRIFWK